MTRAALVVPVAARTVLRDPFLRVMGIVPPAVALLFRYSFPAIDQALVQVLDPTVFRLREYFWFAQLFLIQMAGMFAGGISGFALLEDRDEGILTVMRVTPLGRTGYLTGRLLFPVLLAAVGAATVVPLCGLHRPAAQQFFWAVVASLPGAAVVPLLLSGFAANKVEGLAVFKLLGVLFLGPVVLLLPEHLSFIGWPLSSYWAARAYVAGGAVEAAGVAAVSVMCSVGYGMLARRGLRRRE